MAPGVEYCTTKRYVGRPVYTRFVEYGWLAAGDHEYPIDGVPSTATTVGLNIRLLNNAHELISSGVGVTGTTLGRYGDNLTLRFTLSTNHGHVAAIIEYTK